jgi:hypothetical protein
MTNETYATDWPSDKLIAPGTMPPEQRAAMHALNMGNNPIPAYFAAAFDDHLKQKVGGNEAAKVKVQIAPTRTGGFVAEVDYPSHPGAGAAHFTHRYDRMKDLVAELNRRFLTPPTEGAKGREPTALLLQVPTPPVVDYDAGKQTLYAMIVKHTNLSAACNSMAQGYKPQLAGAVKALYDKANARGLGLSRNAADASITVQVTPTNRLTQAGTIPIEATVQFLGLDATLRARIAEACEAAGHVPKLGDSGLRIS